MIRYSEVGTKASGTRRRLLRVLEENIFSGLEREGIVASVEIERSRGHVEGEDERIGALLTRTFGVKSFSLATEVTFGSLDELIKKGEKYFSKAVFEKTFAVRARRVGDHKFTSSDIAKELGSVLFEKSNGVDLDNPEATAFVEVRYNKAFFMHERVPGPGGLPLRSQGRALVLLSGGFDSAVAAWQLMKRGVGIDYCFMNLGGPIHEEGVLRVAKTLTDLWQHGDEPSITILPFMDVVSAIREKTAPPFWNLVLKRAMLDAATLVSMDKNIDAIATGDAIGQVSSQTLKNIRALGITDPPLLRPLLTEDKDDIIMKSRMIGTEKLSSAIKEYCAIVPEYPVTSASYEALSLEMEKLGDGPVKNIIEKKKTLSLTTLTLEGENILASMAREDIQDGVRVIDVRELATFNLWHMDGAERIDISDAMQLIPKLDKETPILFICEHGLLSAELAYMAREQGIDAWSFKGGAEALMRHIGNVKD